MFLPASIYAIGLISLAVFVIVGVIHLVINIIKSSMDSNRSVVSAKDFFVHLGSIITFYASIIALVSLLFEVINYAYPQVTSYYYGYYSPSIAFQVATLIVAGPLYFVFSWLLQKSYQDEPSLREAPIRKWLAYITLFVAGAIVAGDLVTVIYKYLEGQELTAGFLLKVLVLFVIAGGVFMYYLREIRNAVSPKERNLWRMAAVVVILVSIISGFSVIGSPRAQRERRYDSQRVSDLQSIQWQIVNYWQQKEVLPGALDDVQDPLSGFNLPVDPATGNKYEYERIGNLSFNLCANFDQESVETDGSIAPQPLYAPEISMRVPEVWEHSEGRVCFERTIDPELYPPASVFRK